MRAEEGNAGSIKAFLLILALLLANAALVKYSHPEQGVAESKDPVVVTLRTPPRDPSTALTMTSASRKEGP